MTRIVLTEFGKIDRKVIGDLISTMKECYDKLKPREVELVDLYVFERASAMDAVLAEEKDRLGAESTWTETLFFATHDAWHGTPRIMVCVEKMLRQPNSVNLGGIRHEVGHSVLHGSLEYYFIPIPPIFLKVERKFGLARSLITDLLYLISIAVKDFEVTRLLYQNHYIEDQAAYSKYFLRYGTEETASWQLARVSPLTKILFSASLLKNIGCAIPLIQDEEYGEELRQIIVKSTEYLPEGTSEKIRMIAFNEFPKLGEDTAKNIERVSKPFVREFVVPEFGEKMESEKS